MVQIVTELIDYKDENGKVFEAYVARDGSKNGPLPAVLIFHTYAGRSEHEEERARSLAEMGYVGFAVDVYGKGVRGSTPEENMKLLKPFVEDRDGLLLPRLKLSLETIKKLAYVDSKKIAAIGFCFGGLCVLDMARKIADPALKGVVSIHGLLTKQQSDNSSEKINTKILVLHGYADAHVQPDQVLAFGKEFTERGADWQLHAYGRAMHAFTNKGANDEKRSVKYDADADRRSSEATRYFLNECFA